MKSVYERVLARLSRQDRGYAFSASDFLDLAHRGSIDVALSTLAKEGKIRRVCRGLYDIPRHSELLGGDMAPDLDQVAQAIARKTGARIQPSGAVAANLLGLSEQVPAKILYLTDRLSRTVKIGSQTIAFQQTHPKQLLRDPTSARVVQALRFLGKQAVTNDVIAKIRGLLTPAQRRRLAKDARYASDWIADIARRVAAEAEDG